MFFPVRVLLGVHTSGSVESVDQDRRRWTEITQRLQRELRFNIPARLEGLFRRVERLSVTAAQAGVSRHHFLRIGALFGRC